MSVTARQVLVYRYWLEAMEAAPASDYTQREIQRTVPKLRAAASYLIGWGC